MNNIQKGSFVIMAFLTGMEKVFTTAFQLHSDNKQINPGILYFRNSGLRLKNVTILGKKHAQETCC